MECSIVMMILDCENDKRIIKLCNTKGLDYVIDSVSEDWEVEDEQINNVNDTRCSTITIIKTIPFGTDTPTLEISIKDGGDVVEVIIIVLPECPLPGLGSTGTGVFIGSLVVFVLICCLAVLVFMTMRRPKEKIN